MKIGIVCYPTFGGSGVVATELGKALAQREHDVHFITYTQPARLDFFNEHLFYHEVRVPNYPLFQYPPYEIALASQMVDIAERFDLDLLHVHYAIPHASAAYMARQILLDKGVYVPFITTLHGTDITLVGKEPSYAPVVAFSINQSDGVTAVSKHLRDETMSFFDIRREIEVIPNFIDLQRFRRQQKEHFRKAICPQGEKLLVHTSNFRKVKRVHDVIEVFYRVRQEIPVKLLLIGDGPERSHAEKRCRELKICNDVRFLGKLEAVEEVLSVADVFLMPSEKESFGLAALEAMACEVPVVSSNAGGLPELNEHGKTGFVSPVGDVESMTRHTLQLLRDDELLARFRRQARQRAEMFSLERIVPLYEQYYAKVLEQHKSAV
ncbi:N-acetyl-alpha-D-glucosaminyl L-malate synthase BshA [Thermonema rossianum]|jgi:N-acetyl-alpha-D-glucosaminyl L-malate synthase BshA|uniref:N-acetyl-alpha-D-glucosaminyl L-malate synthase BshA n=1 Tax=Thermonema rossianum TaxID=55505 RepID=UPI00068EB875|nr:N-acetyl-alpha-D-glucosaminyl L-malate synthase BshA [Thermonema rossianum]